MRAQILHRPALRQEGEQILHQHDPDDRVGLAVLHRQARAARLAQLPAQLLDVIRGLRAEGISVIFISHRLHEVEQVADRVVALRDGALAGTLDKDEIEHDRMVKLMIGRDLKVQSEPPATAPGDVALAAVDVRTSTYPAQPVSLALRNGEILGLAGLVGSGRTELARAMFGVDPIYGGHFEVLGQPFRPRAVADAVERGIFLVPEDRKGEGILLDLPIFENVSLPNLRAHAAAFLVTRGSEVKTAEAQRRNLSAEMEEKQRLYGERYPLDEEFLAALAIMPEASGVALGFDRLVMLATGAPRIEDVVWVPVG